MRHDLQETSRTAKLWVLYHKPVRTVQEFILAEDSMIARDIWNVVAKMLGIFAAARHGQYAKFGWLYLQRLPEQYPQVSIIKKKMHASMQLSVIM